MRLCIVSFLILLTLLAPAQIDISNPFFTAAIVRSTGSGASSSLNTSLIAHFKLDEASGDATDSEPTGTPQTFTQTGGPTSGSGKVGTARQLTQSSSQGFTRADSDDLSVLDESWSINIWVNPDALAGTMAIYQKGWDDPYGEMILFYSSGADDYQWQIANGGVSVETAGTSPTVGRWDMVSAGYDADANESWISFNGGTRVTASFTGGNASSAGTAKIGIGLGTFWDGRLDEFSFWKKRLSDAELTELYNSGNGKTCCPF